MQSLDSNAGVHGGIRHAEGAIFWNWLLQAFKTSGEHFFKTSSFSNPLYGSLYGQFCEQREEPVLEMGSSIHLEDLWTRLQSSPILKRGPCEAGEVVFIL